METPELKTAVKSNIDFAITKDDILTVLLSEKEQKYNAIIEKKNKEIEDYSEKLTLSKNNIYDAIKTQYNLKKSDIINKTIKEDYSNKIEYNVYDIGRLEGLKNPKLAKNKKFKKGFMLIKMSADIEIMRDYKTKDGFAGTLRKVITIDSDNYKHLISECNKIIKKLAKAEEEVSEYEYKVLILDTDKSIKSSLIKKIVNTSDYSTLLLENK